MKKNWKDNNTLLNERIQRSKYDKLYALEILDYKVGWVESAGFENCPELCKGWMDFNLKALYKKDIYNSSEDEEITIPFICKVYGKIDPKTGIISWTKFDGMDYELDRLNWEEEEHIEEILDDVNKADRGKSFDYYHLSEYNKFYNDLEDLLKESDIKTRIKQ